MTKLSNNNGRAFEYATINVINNYINSINPNSAHILEDMHYQATKKAWDSTDANTQQELTQASKAIIPGFFELEPNCINGGNIELKIQADSQGEIGDVRDIVIKKINWEIGLSLKHNHFAVKHSRLSKGLDFGQRWYKVSCAQSYWQKVNPIWQKLDELNSKNTLFSSLSNKIEDIYIPILEAFVNEVSRASISNSNVPKRMVEYLLGTYDFWKMIGIDSSKVTKLIAFNLHNSLGKNSTIVIPETALPTQILSVGINPKKRTTAYICMDNGWQFSFRIHNAEKICCSSLKFDIQIVGMPTALMQFNFNW